MAYLEKERAAFPKAEIPEYSRHEEFEMLLQHIEKVIKLTGFINDSQPNKVMTKLRRLFSRARPEAQEINILRGVLTSVEKMNKN